MSSYNLVRQSCHSANHGYLLLISCGNNQTNKNKEVTYESEKYYEHRITVFQVVLSSQRQ